MKVTPVTKTIKYLQDIPIYEYPMNPVYITKSGKRWLLTCWISLAAMLLLSEAKAQNITVFRQSLEGAKGQLSTDSSVTVQDSIFFDPAQQNRLELPYKVRNVVTFRINEHASRYQPSAYAADVQFRLIYTKPDHTIDSVDTHLQVNYDSAGVYTGRNYLVFENAHRLTVKVLGFQSGTPSAIQSLMLDVEMQAFPVYKLACVDDAIRTINSNNPPNTDSTDAILVSWPAVTGADEYDLEWAYIDSSALGRYGNPVNPKLIFRNNASRITTAGNSFKIPLLYDNGEIVLPGPGGAAEGTMAAGGDILELGLSWRDGRLQFLRAPAPAELAVDRFLRRRRKA